MGNIEYINLESLIGSDYKISEGQSDITGWNVEDESGTRVGVVRDLLFDPEQNTIRYLVMEIDNPQLSAEQKLVLIPIGLVEVPNDNAVVIIPVIRNEQYQAMPAYVIGEVMRDMEEAIREAIGSPAALRIEEELAELKPENFYHHHHFDRGRFTIINKAQHPGTDAPISAVSGNAIGPHSIGQIVGGDQTSSQSYNKTFEDFRGSNFDVETIYGIYTVEPQENGTYRIMENAEKIGVIYAEPAADGGVEWETMDYMDIEIVKVIGIAVTAHNNSTSA